ncbi:MAG: hypothetical protein JO265_16235 [Acidimicrobiia bacterium]|nr:hypothetical protein [Acidimicrobiia bacterium]
MPAVATFVFVAFAVWTLVAFAAAVLLGHTLQRLEPAPVPATRRRVVDLRQPR